MSMLLGAVGFLKNNKQLCIIAVAVAVFGAIAINIGKYIKDREDSIRENSFAQCSMKQEQRENAALHNELDRLIEDQEKQISQLKKQREKSVRMFEKEREKSQVLTNKIQEIKGVEENYCKRINDDSVRLLNESAVQFNARGSSKEDSTSK